VSKLIKTLNIKLILEKEIITMEKVAFISGANRGIGFQTSIKLAESGVKVILGSRDLNKGEEAVKKLSNV
jgi:NAD(P)-dependent dehydrogenase (short-subunit alcohol dehydrogenase family)